MSEIPTLEALEDFLLNAPLYEQFRLKEDCLIVSYIYGKKTAPKFDGHCPYCSRETVFKLTKIAHIPNGDPWRDIKTHVAYDDIIVTCGRNDSHRMRFYFVLNEMKIQKIGQMPSLADIANDEAKQYKKELSKVDSFEFYRAIGLAAHGVGVGSFVYLRRVFERLIYTRFEEFQASEGWDSTAFKSMRMDEKIGFLKNHLPDFLVENSKVYSILSKGIHELEEQTCLAAFGFLKDSIIMILDEDKKKKAELQMKKKLAASIANFQTPKSKQG